MSAEIIANPLKVTTFNPVPIPTAKTFLVSLSDAIASTGASDCVIIGLTYAVYVVVSLVFSFIPLLVDIGIACSHTMVKLKERMSLLQGEFNTRGHESGRTMDAISKQDNDLQKELNEIGYLLNSHEANVNRSSDDFDEYESMKKIAKRMNDASVTSRKLRNCHNRAMREAKKTS